MVDRNLLLSVLDLDVSFNGSIHALRGVNFYLFEGEIHALVGESGSGKTVTANCIMGLIPMPPCRINRGSVIFKEQDLLALSEYKMRHIRGREIAMIFQEPAKYLNPGLKIGEQIIEMSMLHLGMNRKEAEARALNLLDLVGLKGCRSTLRSYAHEFSGGMKQRVMIAMAISCNPTLLIADEPTTALDVTLQMQILKLILRLKTKFNMSILFISHDLAVVHEISDRISVIYAGKIVESACRQSLFDNPLHPYTRLLLMSMPEAGKRGTRLRAIPGTVPDARAVPAGCSFHPRCPLADNICKRKEPDTINYGEKDMHTAACHFIGKKWIS